MLRRLSARLQSTLPASTVDAHCDGPCGIYDPASARIAAEAVRSMVKKIHALHIHDENDATEVLGYHNNLSRYIAIKEEEAETTKRPLPDPLDRLLQAASPRGLPRPARHVLEGRQAVLRLQGRNQARRRQCPRRGLREHPQHLLGDQEPRRQVGAGRRLSPRQTGIRLLRALGGPLWFRVRGRSMEPTLHAGDLVVIRPHRDRRRVSAGALIVADDPDQPDRVLVKRVVRSDSDGVTVSADNRADGRDSRHFGPLPCIRGVVVFVWSKDGRVWRPTRTRRSP